MNDCSLDEENIDKKASQGEFKAAWLSLVGCDRTWSMSCTICYCTAKSFLLIFFKCEAECGTTHFNDGLWEGDNSPPPKKLHFLWQLLPLVPKSSFSEMFCDSCAQSHPSYSYLPPHKTHKHRQTCVCISPPRTKTLAEATEIAVDCEQKDNSHCCCVGVTQLSLIVPTLCDSLGKTGLREKPLQSAETSGCLIVCPQTCASLLISPTRSFEPTLVSHTALAGSLWRTVSVGIIMSGNEIKSKVFLWVERSHRENPLSSCFKSSGLPTWCIWFSHPLLHTSAVEMCCFTGVRTRSLHQKTNQERNIFICMLAIFSNPPYLTKSKMRKWPSSEWFWCDYLFSENSWHWSAVC